MSDSNRIDALETRVAELERLLTEANKGKAKKASVLSDCEKAAAVEAPRALQSHLFLTIWKEFCAHRCTLATKGTINGKKFPWTERAAKGLLKKCEAFGVALAIEAMNTSMDKQWADIFEPNGSTGQLHQRHQFEI